MAEPEPSFYDPPGHAELLVLTQMLELPHDLRVDGAIAIYGDRQDSLFDGATDAMKAAILGSPIAEPGLDPIVRFVFRRANVRAQLPLEAADLCFDDWVKPLLPRRVWRRRKRQLRFLSKRGIRPPVTVVAATRYLSVGDWPSDRSGQVEALGRERASSIDLLNDFLTALGLVTRESSIGSIASGDLPFLTPVLVESGPMPAGVRHGTSFTYMSGGQMPSLDLELRDVDQVRLAADLTRSHIRGEQPFWLVFELLNRAMRNEKRGLYAQTVLDIGTMVEVLIATVVRETMSIRGVDASKIDNVLMAGFKNIVVDHLEKCSGLKADLSDLNSPVGKWWDVGYGVRTAVAHEGLDASRAQCDAMIEATSELISAAKAALIAQPDTKELGESLAIEIVRPEAHENSIV